MATKKAKTKAKIKSCFNYKQGLLFLALAFLGALGFAAFIQGILMQISFGFKYGFFSYLLGFIFIGSAKYLKYKLYRELKFGK
ncbi:MAG: hypothetical protein U9Q69_05280 [Nanoarchaeota archaeon]|nr:hypothetical protein [Nanoarchaeota archaeon]